VDHGAVSPRRRAGRAAYALALLALGACADAAPALRVGDAAFPAEEVAGLDAASLALLADITALGLAVAGERIDSLGAPFVALQAERARLAVLPYALAARDAGLDEAALRAAYVQRPEWELTVRHLVRLVPRWAGEAEARQARDAAAAALARIEAGEEFATVAAETSEEPGAAERGGLLQPGREGTWVAPFWQAALALEPGGTSGLVRTEYGYHVLRLERREPVPFEEADRARLLRGLASPGAALAALERWVATAAPAALPDAPALLEARRALDGGRAPDSLLIARGADWEYTAWTLALARALADAEERERLARADEIGFGRWAEDDVRRHAWAAEAARMGVPAPRDTAAVAAREWARRAAGLGAAFGFRAGMREAQVRAAALAGLRATRQEPAIARRELPLLRPMLRRAYAVSGDALSERATSSTSDTR
jgi:hypothetical protein